MTAAWLVLLVLGPAAWVVTAGVRRYVLARGVLDVPNARSSHTVVTPRGGGIAIGTVVLAAAALLAALGLLGSHTFVTFAVGAGAVSLVGWLDDTRGVRPAVRGAVHTAAAVWAVLRIGAPEALIIGTDAAVPLGPAGPVFAVLWIGWCINFYNFMDGIDGLAAGQAALTGGAAGALLLAAGAPDLALLAFVLAAGALGFLIWNWQPARIFMGDVGSGMLGYAFGVLALAGDVAGALPLPLWGLLLGVFLFDATATLLRRVLRGERWYSAHRSHAYQRAVVAGWSHARVATAALVIGAALCALAIIAWQAPAFTLAALAIGTTMLLAAYLHVERRQPMD